VSSLPAPDEESSTGHSYIIHETLATKDVGKEARRIFNVRARLVADHLLAILVVNRAQILSDETNQAGHIYISALNRGRGWEKKWGKNALDPKVLGTPR
jgi:hypothetical protein